jgi:carboxymethylenebutenolidase
MKKLFIFFMLIASCSLTFSQKRAASCCLPAATEKFASFANDRTFVMSHDAPLPFVYRSENGQDITFKAADGTDAHGWMIKAAKPTDYYLFVIHEWWGLNDYVKQQSEKMSSDLGMNVIALDLYDRKIAATPEEAGKLVQTVKTDRAVNIIKGAYNYAGTKAKVFTIGWCFGGGWSLQTALLGGSQVVGCVMFYGMPEADVNKLMTLHSDVIGFFCQQRWLYNAENC